MDEVWVNVAELKIDGLSLSLHYEDQILRRGVTRGDGRIGEDVTTNARTIRSVPLRLRAANLKSEISNLRSQISNLEVRGEAFIPRKVFERINAEREERMTALRNLATPRRERSGCLIEDCPSSQARDVLPTTCWLGTQPFCDALEALTGSRLLVQSESRSENLCSSSEEVIAFAGK